mmetsp:Transcript_21095/g.66703  ORF Transcript_21095/g.66703 Transcript_21095/m.66703 type:complete len:583 (-) Transcript_21095:152-1900(-)
MGEAPHPLARPREEVWRPGARGQGAPQRRERHRVLPAARAGHGHPRRCHWLAADPPAPRYLCHGPALGEWRVWLEQQPLLGAPHGPLRGLRAAGGCVRHPGEHWPQRSGHVPGCRGGPDADDAQHGLLLAQGLGRGAPGAQGGEHGPGLPGRHRRAARGLPAGLRRCQRHGHPRPQPLGARGHSTVGLRQGHAHQRLEEQPARPRAQRRHELGLDSGGGAVRQPGAIPCSAAAALVREVDARGHDDQALPQLHHLPARRPARRAQPQHRRGVQRLRRGHRIPDEASRWDSHGGLHVLHLGKHPGWHDQRPLPALHALQHVADPVPSAGGLPLHRPRGAPDRRRRAGQLARRGPAGVRGRDLPLRAARAGGAPRREHVPAAAGEGGHCGQDWQRQVHACEHRAAPRALAGRAAKQRWPRTAGRCGRGHLARQRPPQPCRRRPPGADDPPGEPQGERWPGLHGRGGSDSAGVVQPGCTAGDTEGYLGGGLGFAHRGGRALRGPAAAPHGRAGPCPQAQGAGAGRVHGVPGSRVRGPPPRSRHDPRQGRHPVVHRPSAALRAAVRPRLDPVPRGGCRLRHAGQAT